MASLGSGLGVYLCDQSFLIIAGVRPSSFIPDRVTLLVCDAYSLVLRLSVDFKQC